MTSRGCLTGLPITLVVLGTPQCSTHLQIAYEFLTTYYQEYLIPPEISRIIISIVFWGKERGLEAEFRNSLVQANQNTMMICNGCDTDALP